MGTVVVSVDAELGWGHNDIGNPPTERIEGAREGWKTLISLFDRYQLPATWAVVGHLFLDDCDGTHPAHPAHEEWFARERDEWAARPELRFGAGLVDELLAADVNHDIGLHTFSHVEFGHPSTDETLARAEIQHGFDAAEQRGILPRSFVFPRNSVGHRELLASSPIRVYRGTSPVRPTGPFRPLRKVARAAFGRSLLVEPSIDEYGLVNVPNSLNLFSFEGRLRSVVEPIIGDPVVQQARHGIDQAARADGVFHVYLHPNDLTDARDVRRIDRILRMIVDYRRSTPLRVKTMHGVATTLLDGPEPALQSPSLE